MGLDRINRVKAALDLHFECPVITVAGTNGKGSTCAYLESILLASGYKVGCHMSPHLLNFNERARVNGEEVNDALLLEHFAAVEKARVSLVDAPTLTYFEFTTLAIMHLFSKLNLDAVVLEVGMGGRLDAVNIVDADCAIVTSIDIDHADFLGGTREAIGREKAGIFRPGAIAVCGDPVPPQSLIDYAEELGCDLWLQGRDYNFQGDKQQWGWAGRQKRFSGLGYPALRGANQILNASAVIAALMALHQRLPVSAQDIRNGFALVELPGRFQVLPGQPTVVLDVAHNPHAAKSLAINLKQTRHQGKTIAVFAMLADKDITGVIQALSGEIDAWYVATIDNVRGSSAFSLSKMIVDTLPCAEIKIFNQVVDAFHQACIDANENDRIITLGSFFTVAEVMQDLQTKKQNRVINNGAR